MSDPIGEDLEEFERVAKAATSGHVKLCLYIVGSSPRSAKAVSNIKTICEEHLRGRYDLEVIDLYQSPEIAMRQQVLAAPTLVRESPSPVRKIVGDMSDENKVLYSLNIEVR